MASMRTASQDHKIVDVDEEPEDIVTSPPSSSIEVSDENVIENDDTRGLTKGEIWNVTFALLAWASTISVNTLVVGTSAVVLLSIGGDPNLTSLPLGVFFFGASIVSLLVTPWCFVRWGRKLGFLLGILFGLVAAILGLLSIELESVFVLVLSMFSFGMATGVGFFLRFAAVEVVPTHWKARAVTLVVSGGVIAAFVGPEASQATKDLFDKEYMGIFMITAIFNVFNAFCIWMISFPALETASAVSPPKSEERLEESSALREPEQKQSDANQNRRLYSMIKSRAFVVPMLVATLAWSCMGMPMSIVRVVMGQVGFSSRESLTTIEFHFLGMYLPGFMTGHLISVYGPQLNVLFGIVLFAIALLCSFMADEKDGDKSNMSLWVISLFIIGFAWNLVFTSATIWTTALYSQAPELKSRIQAANDCLMFLVSGAWLVSSSYIFEKGGSQLDGWHTVNWVVAGLVGLMGAILATDKLFANAELRKAQGSLPR